MIQPRTLAGAIVAFLSLGASPVRGAAQQPASRRPIAITRVTVIDVATGERRPLQTVVVRGRGITQVANSADVPVVPSGSIVVDGRGLFLIPALWDMSVHLGERAATSLPLFLAYGVTGVRELESRSAGSATRIAALRDDVAAGRAIGPRIVLGATPELPASPTSATTIVGFADSLLAGCVSRDSAAIEAPSCAATGQRMSRAGTAWAPALISERWQRDRFDAPPLADEERLYLSRDAQRAYDRALGTLQRDTGEVWRQRFRRRLALAPALQRAGVTLLAGTDVGVLGHPVPGHSLHQELGLLVEAGLSPLQALQAATINPARALGAVDSLGTVSTGKLAELVLLDADPTIDIANARRVRGVFSGGRYFDRAALDAMLRPASAAIAAERPAVSR